MGFRVADLAFTLVPEILADTNCEQLSAQKKEECEPPSDYDVGGGGGNCDVKSAPGGGREKGPPETTRQEALPDLRLQLAHTLEMLEKVH